MKISTDSPEFKYCSINDCPSNTNYIAANPPWKCFQLLIFIFIIITLVVLFFWWALWVWLFNAALANSCTLPCWHRIFSEKYDGGGWHPPRHHASGSLNWETLLTFHASSSVLKVFAYSCCFFLKWKKSHFPWPGEYSHAFFVAKRVQVSCA